MSESPHWISAERGRPGNPSPVYLTIRGTGEFGLARPDALRVAMELLDAAMTDPLTVALVMFELAHRRTGGATTGGVTGDSYRLFEELGAVPQ